MFDRFDSIAGGDMIDAPFWPGRITVTEVRSSDDGMSARVFWTAPEGDGVTWLPERALVRLVRPFRPSDLLPAYRVLPSRLHDAVKALAIAQHQAGIGTDPGDYDATATMSALITEG